MTKTFDSTVSQLLQDNSSAEYVDARENPIALREKDHEPDANDYVDQESVKQDAIRLFNSDLGFKVRVILRAGDPWFVAKDVAACIDHKDVSTMCKLCRDKDKVVVNFAELKHSADLAECFKGQQSPNLTLISESGLYRILAKCNLPKCEPFESWVFDEILPSIRKTGSYGVQPRELSDAEIMSRALEIAHRTLALREERIKALEVERDEAIRTKHHFVEGRDAKVCGELGGLRTQNEALRKQIGDAKKYKAVTAISWLPDYFDMSNRGLYGSLAAKLKKLEAEMPREFAHTDIPDSRYGTVKAYHVGVIERLHEMVQADETLMAKYRKTASV